MRLATFKCPEIDVLTYNFKMDPFKKFLVLYICCILVHEKYGRKVHSYTPYNGSGKPVDQSKFVEKKVDNIYQNSSIGDGRPQTEHLYKINAGMSKFQKTLPPSKNKNYLLKSDLTDNTLEIHAGEHLVKVQSKKEPLSSVSKSAGLDKSINPKYSHVIEIIHRGDSLQKLEKPAQLHEATKMKQDVELTKTADFEVSKSEISGENEEDFNNAEEISKESDENKELSEDEGMLNENNECDAGEFNEDGVAEETNEEELSECHKGLAEEANESTEEKFSESDEETTDNELTEGERMPEEFDETDEEEFSEGGEMPEEFDETEEEFSETEGIPEETGEEEFSETDEGMPEESEETGEEEFSEDEEMLEESDEIGEDEFNEGDQGMPSEFDETDEDEEMLDEFDETEEEFNEGISEEYDEIEEELSEADQGISADSETDEGNFEFEADKIDSQKTEEKPALVDEKDSDESENIKIFMEASSDKVNETSNEKGTNNEESDFKEEFEGSGEEFADTNDQNAKSGRILGMFSRQNETFPICTTPKGEAGRCRRLGECLLSEALNNFNGFLQQLCLIRGARVGICCPDNPVIEIVNPDENATSELKTEEIIQPPEGCGLNTKTRIVGGTISVPHEWTWMVALMRRNRFYCGGVIINNYYILTAAHCVMGMNVKDLTVRLGEYDFNEDSKHTEDLSVSEIKRHAQFVTLTFQHDIALLKLKRSIKYSKYVGSICLPDQKARDYSDAKGTVVGWGTVSFGGAASPVLRQVTVPVWKNEDCDKTYLLESIGDSFMCAGSPEKGEDACQGDSGGPLMTVNESGRWEVIGLVSWGRRCGDPTYPGVYTRVTTYLDWIKQNAV